MNVLANILRISADSFYFKSYYLPREVNNGMTTININDTKNNAITVIKRYLY